MKRPVAAVLLALVLLGAVPTIRADSGPTPASGFTVLSAVWGTPSSPAEAGPGSVNVPLTVTVQYYFANTATGMKATLSPSFGFTDANGNANPTAYVTGNIASGTVLPLTFYLNIGPGVQVGSYLFSMTITWGALVSGSVINSVSLVQQTTVTVNLFGRVRLFYQATPSVLTAGDITSVELSVTNAGTGGASQVSTSVSSSQSVSVLNSIPDISVLGSNASTSARLSVYAPPSSAGAPVTLTVTSTYFDAYGIKQSFTQPIGFLIAPLEAISPVNVSVTPLSLMAGRINNVTITLSNAGKSTIKSMSVAFSVVGTQATWLGSNVAQAVELQPGQALVVPDQVYVSPSTSGSITIQCSFSYTYRDIPSQETRTVGLLSRGLVDISLTGSTVLPDPVGLGQIVSMTLTLTNLGTIAASGVTATAKLPQGFSAIGSGSDFIGDMAVDSPSTFTLSAYVSNSTSPGEHQIQVRLGYFDNLRTPLSKTLNLTVTVSASNRGTTGSGGPQGASGGPSGGGSALFVVGYAAVALVILGGGFLWVRRRRNRRSVTQ